MRDKLKLTEELVKQLPGDRAVNLEAARTTWWFNLRPGSGLRLTSLGFEVLTKHLKLEYYSYQLPDVYYVTQQTILKLDRKLQNPYYIVAARKIPTHIIFFSSKEAMLINLYGDLDKFLDNYK